MLECLVLCVFVCLRVLLFVCVFACLFARFLCVFDSEIDLVCVWLFVLLGSVVYLFGILCCGLSVVVVLFSCLCVCFSEW